MANFLADRRYLLVWILIFLVTACAKDKLDPHVRAHLEKPDWITGDSDNYPPSVFLLGRSVSAKLNRAKRQSADELAQTIDNQLQAPLSNEKSEAPKAADVSQVLDHETRDFLIRHIRISEIWQDPATHAYHVLSTIDRVKAGDELLNEVYRLDEQVDRIMNKAGEEKDTLQRIAFANLAITKQRQRDQLQSVITIIKPIANIPKTDWNRRKIEEQISYWLNEVKIMPIAKHEDFNLLGAMKEGVSSAGMTVHFGARPDYILKGTFSRGQIKWQDGVYSLEGNLQLELLDGQWKGQLRGDANWPIEVSALERDQLQDQLEQAIRQAHEKRLRSTLLSIEE